jgi:Na+-transporting NADH:ubiquinone oxidoreductase subunit B
MPVDVPLWILAVGVAFAVIIGKEVFGGTGMNIWNPALLARAFVFFAYPSHISGDKVWISGLTDNASAVVDGFSGATPLAQATSNIATPDFLQMFIGNIPGSIGETSTIAILLGAVLLIWTGVASWKIMVSCVAGALFVGLIANSLAPEGSYAAYPVWNHLVMGGFAFGAVFMATDPVTSAQTECGKWIYGFFVGALAIIIRLFNPGYAEGMMLAILFMNTAAPLIDHYVVEANIKRRMKPAKK